MSGELNTIENFEEQAYEILKDSIDLLVRKRKDYGPNALKGGCAGIAIRMGDKMARLENLLGIVDGSMQPKAAIIGDEKTEDTVKDLLNYSILYLMESRRNKK